MNLENNDNVWHLGKKEPSLSSFLKFKVQIYSDVKKVLFLDPEDSKLLPTSLDFEIREGYRSKVIEFEIFRDLLETKLLNTNKKNNAGSKTFDVVMMFKIMILQRYYGLGDTQIKNQILNRLIFKKFLSIESGDKVPDEKTV